MTIALQGHNQSWIEPLALVGQVIPDAAQIRCQWIAERLDELNVGEQAIAAGVCIWLIQKRLCNENQLSDSHGPAVLDLVQRVQRLKVPEAIDFRQSDISSEELELNLRMMIVTMLDDTRTVIVRAVERSSTLQDMVDNKAPRREIVALVSELKRIYIPIVARLGIWKLRTVMEDLCFKALTPGLFGKVTELMAAKLPDWDTYLEEKKLEIQHVLKAESLDVQISHRIKNAWSTYRKMRRNRLKELPSDLMGLRLIVADPRDCYLALAALHTKWRHIPDELDDYISNSKPSGYQSIHTVLLIDGHGLEVQIRTAEMNQVAEVGAAAHWVYKGDSSSTGVQEWFDRKLKRLRTVTEQGTSHELSDYFGPEEFMQHMYVVTSKGAIVELPTGATVLDYAYIRGHGAKCSTAWVNNRWVSRSHVLQNGDLIRLDLSSTEQYDEGFFRAAAVSISHRVRQALQSLA